MHSMLLILGSSGQLGKTFYQYKTKKTKFLCRKDVDFEKFDLLKKKILSINPEIIINCAAYTNVDLAEKEKAKANKINHTLVKKLAQLCEKKKMLLIHYSTDYVFNGNKSRFNEKDETNPINHYGKSKLEGEKSIVKNCKKFYIFRISWLYSIYNKNFPKTIIRLLKQKNEIQVVNDQYGCPTSCELVVKTTLKILKKNNLDYGIYHISCLGRTSWYKIAEFLQKNIKKINIKCKKIKKISSKNLNSLAKRPKSSYLNCKLLQKKLNIIFPEWKKEIKKHINSL